MKLLLPPVEIKEDEGFSKEVDIFNRKPFGEALFNLIKNTDDELVLALDAPWGEGKSTFIKMWRGYLTKNKVKHVYFDAFENDYQLDPFLAISSQIYSLLDETDENAITEFKQKATSAIKVVARAGLRVAIKAGTAGILDETMLEGVGDVGQETSGLIDNYIESQLTKAHKGKKQLEAFKECLSNLGDALGGEGKLVFIIDELDRCKPHFALLIIESIKHFFSVPNITFVLVMNRQQLEESIRCEYGRGVDASKYLQKFVSVWTSLPKPNSSLQSVPKKYLRYCLERLEYPKGLMKGHTVSVLEDFVTYYNLSLREIEQSLTNFSIIFNIYDNDAGFDELLSVGVAFASIVKVTKPNLYLELANNSVSYSEFIEKSGLGDLGGDSYPQVPEGHPYKYLFKFFLGTDDEVNDLLKQTNLFQLDLWNRDLFLEIFGWLENFKKI